MKLVSVVRWISVLGSLSWAAETGEPLSSAGGRFVFGMISEYRADTFMLDTQTGRLWQLVLTADSVKILQSVNYSDLKVKSGRLYKAYAELPMKPDSTTLVPLETDTNK